jgi:hypothetical protein
MFYKITTVFVVVTLVMGISFAQNKEVMRKAPIIINEPSENYVPTTHKVNKIQDDGYILIDSMANAFGPAISTINPFAYDPYADVVAFVHRGQTAYAGGSGELWYNISTDKGLTWTRVSAINSTNPQILARYPSMAILNPTKGTINDATAGFAWPELKTTSSFGWVGYGVDQPVGAGSTYSAILQDEGNYSSQTPCWASDNDNWFFWDSDFGTSGNAAIRFFRTQDFLTVEEINPPQWASSVFQDNGNIVLGGVSFNAVQYFAVLGSFVDPDPGNPIEGGWYPGLSKSTDNGATWSDFEVIDFRTIPALSEYDVLYDYKIGDTYVSFCGDINVDKDGYVHLVIPVTDFGTTDTTNSIAEIFETASGWDAKIITNDLLAGSYQYGPGLAQMGPSTYLAFDESRNMEVCQWVNGIAPEKYCDIFMSYRFLDGDWSTPVNLTNSATINNTQSHLAPTLAFNGTDTYTAFSMYGYVSGVTGPWSDTTKTTNIYIKPVEITIVGVNDKIVANDFGLEQNYPNPFNPSTKINYNLAERSNVSLKVYDILGNEVATLVNTTEDAGKHAVTFDGKNLASGLYIYTLKAGNFTSSKKMILIK